MTRYAQAIGPGRRAAAVARVASSYLRAHQLVDATYRVTAGGYGVAILVPAAEACGDPARVAADPEFVRDLRDALGFLRVVTVRVAGQNADLGSYRRRQCTSRARVYERTGSGAFTSPGFAIAGGGWYVVFGSVGGGAQLEVRRSPDTGRPVSTLTLGSGGTTGRAVVGSGRFRLTIRGRRQWTVVVLRRALSPIARHPRGGT